MASPHQAYPGGNRGLDFASDRVPDSRSSMGPAGADGAPTSPSPWVGKAAIHMMSWVALKQVECHEKQFSILTISSTAVHPLFLGAYRSMRGDQSTTSSADATRHINEL